MGKYKEFIKDAYNGKVGLEMCPRWKDKLKQEFPELFKESELEVGKWYREKIKDSGFRLFCYQGYTSYGFGSIGWEWSSGLRTGNIDLSRYKEATHQEVEEALIKEAKRRGFKEGVRFKIIKVSYRGKINRNKTFENLNLYYESNNELIMDLTTESYTIFKDGEWAEIIKPKEMTKEEIEKELGYNITIA